MANGYLSDAFADLVLAAVLAGATGGLPASLWVGLTTVLPTDGEGAGVVEPAAAEYGRVELPCDAGTWSSMGARSMETAVDVEFAPALTDWGQILGYPLYDAETAGVYLGYGVLAPYIVTAGMRARLPAGLIVVTMPTT